MASPIEPGVQIGGYRITEVLGQGGMGLVFKAYHERLQRWAAIKVLLHYGRRGDEMARFEREAQAVASLRHPAILTIFDFGEFEEQPYMITEYMSNGSLDAHMPGARQSSQSVPSLLPPLAQALDYAHERGLIHRDVKPANIFLDERFRPVLADFGLAKLFSADALTMSGVVSGTPSHMSPEQARGMHLTGAADQYSLAVLAFSLLTGQLPFAGSSAMDLLYAHVNAPVPSARALNPELPDGVDAVVGRGLAKQASDRWPGCGVFAEALVDALTRRRVPAVATLPAQGAEPGPAASSTDARAGGPAATEPGRRGRGGRRWVGLAAALALIAAVGATVAYMNIAGVGPFEPAADEPSPRPSASASAAPPAPTLQVEPAPPLRIGGTVTVSGRGLDPRRPASVGILQGQVHPLLDHQFQPEPDGSFRVEGTVPADLQPGSLKLLACNMQDASHSDPPERCGQLVVQVSR